MPGKRVPSDQEAHERGSWQKLLEGYPLAKRSWLALQAWQRKGHFVETELPPLRTQSAQFASTQKTEAYYIALRWVKELETLSQKIKQGSRDPANLERAVYSRLAAYLAPFLFLSAQEGRATMNEIMDHFVDLAAQSGEDLQLPKELHGQSIQDLWNVPLQVDQLR